MHIHQVALPYSLYFTLPILSLLFFHPIPLSLSLTCIPLILAILALFNLSTAQAIFTALLYLQLGACIIYLLRPIPIIHSIFLSLFLACETLLALLSPFTSLPTILHPLLLLLYPVFSLSASLINPHPIKHRTALLTAQLAFLLAAAFSFATALIPSPHLAETLAFTTLSTVFTFTALLSTMHGFFLLHNSPPRNPPPTPLTSPSKPKPRLKSLQTPPRRTSALNPPPPSPTSTSTTSSCATNTSSSSTSVSHAPLTPQTPDFLFLQDPFAAPAMALPQNLRRSISGPPMFQGAQSFSATPPSPGTRMSAWGRLPVAFGGSGHAQTASSGKNAKLGGEKPWIGTRLMADSSGSIGKGKKDKGKEGQMKSATDSAGSMIESKKNKKNKQQQQQHIQTDDEALAFDVEEALLAQRLLKRLDLRDGV